MVSLVEFSAVLIESPDPGLGHPASKFDSFSKMSLNLFTLEEEICGLLLNILGLTPSSVPLFTIVVTHGFAATKSHEAANRRRSQREMSLLGIQFVPNRKKGFRVTCLRGERACFPPKSLSPPLLERSS